MAFLIDDLAALADGELLRRWFPAGDVGDPENDAIKAELDRRDAVGFHNGPARVEWIASNWIEDSNVIAMARRF